MKFLSFLVFVSPEKELSFSYIAILQNKGIKQETTFNNI